MKRSPVLISGLLCLMVLVGASSLFAQSTCKVERIVFATSVEDREPVGENTEFDQSVGRVHCWTKITAENPPVAFSHVWYKGDQKVLEVPLKANYSSTRSWSNKAISPGDWNVEVLDEKGEVLGSARFTVK